MTLIAKYVSITVELCRITTHPQYRQRGASNLTVNILRNYLAEHPFISSKRNDYEDWSRANTYMQKASCKINFELIASIKNNMNRNRKTFDWSHLT